jgi:hypothetical protein
VNAIRLLAGPRARERIARDGLRATDVAAVAGAAGGPEGLAFLGLDEWLFGEWLRDGRRAMRECAAMAEDLAGFARRPDPTRLEPIGGLR